MNLTDTPPERQAILINGVYVFVPAPPAQVFRSAPFRSVCRPDQGRGRGGRAAAVRVLRGLAGADKPLCPIPLAKPILKPREGL